MSRIFVAAPYHGTVIHRTVLFTKAYFTLPFSSVTSRFSRLIIIRSTSLYSVCHRVAAGDTPLMLAVEGELTTAVATLTREGGADANSASEITGE